MRLDDRDLSMLSDLWTDVQASGEAQELEAELRRELSDGHVLAAQPVSVVAARKLRKEVIVRLLNDGRWAWVHLTWATESDPRWPSVEVRESWADLIGVLRESSRD
jgi:hypothetical protein